MMASNPRVFHLITRLLKGGAESKTIETVLGLEGYEFTVGHGAAFDPDQVERLERAGVSTRRFASIRHYDPVTAFPAVFAVARYIRKRDFDIVHTHSTEAGIIGRFAAALAGTPAVVHTVHGVPFAEDRNALLEGFVLHFERLAARRTDILIANADAIAEEYLRRGIGRPEQYTTVYSGIDIERFRDAEPTPDVDGDGVRVLMVGRMADGKGFEDLLAAIDRIGTEDISVYLVGDGPLCDGLKSTIERRSLTDTVTMLGFRDDIPEIMAACDMFVLPSYREGTPRVITEAMASGLPVIATGIAGIPEQVVEGENGFLVRPGDVDALADQIDKLTSAADLRERLGRAGSERVEEFSVDRMLSDVNAVYRELVPAHAR